MCNIFNQLEIAHIFCIINDLLNTIFLLVLQTKIALQLFCEALKSLPIFFFRFDYRVMNKYFLVFYTLYAAFREKRWELSGKSTVNEIERFYCLGLKWLKYTRLYRTMIYLCPIEINFFVKNASFMVEIAFFPLYLFGISVGRNNFLNTPKVKLAQVDFWYICTLRTQYLERFSFPAIRQSHTLCIYRFVSSKKV